MAQTVLKYSLILLELLSILTLIFVYGEIIYNMIKLIYQNLENRMYFFANYSINMNNHSNFINVEILLDNITHITQLNYPVQRNNTNPFVYFILSGKYYESHNNILDLVKESKFTEKCYFYRDISCLNHNSRYALNPINQFLTAGFNIALFSILFLFWVSFKITMSIAIFKYIKDIFYKERKGVLDKLPTPLLNKKYFFNQFVLYLTLVFGLKTFYDPYINLNFESCLEFNINSYEAFYYDREFIYDVKNPTIAVGDVITKTKLKYVSDYFIFTSTTFEDIAKNQKQYYIILFLCSLVWTSKYFDLFSPKNKKKEILSFFQMIILSFSILILLTFICYGFLSFIDNIILGFLNYSYNSKRIITPKAIIIIINVLSQCILFLIVIIQSIINKKRNIYKKYYSFFNETSISDTSMRQIKTINNSLENSFKSDRLIELDERNSSKSNL